MSANNNSSAVASVNTGLTFTADQVSEMIKSGIVREDYIMLTSDLFDREYTFVGTPKFIQSKSRPDVNIPVITIRRDDGRLINIWGGTLLSALVLERKDSVDKVPSIPAAGELPIFFEDEFTEILPYLNKVSSACRHEDGSVVLPGTFTIKGAVTKRSELFKDRWNVGFKFYDQWQKFLALHNSLKPKDAKASTWISEERLLEISDMPVVGRTYKLGDKEITCPSRSELKIYRNADKDPRSAAALLIIDLPSVGLD
jgi:hypothetical protein